VLAWYTLATLLSFYNKLLLGHDTVWHVMGEPFPAPLFMSGVQFAMQHVLARAAFASGLAAREGNELSWMEWAKKILPNGMATGMDIGLSNMSLVFITLSFYTMCKSTMPLFLVAFAIAFGLETPSWRLIMVVTVIVVGLVLLVAGEVDFDVEGFLMVMTAACLSGFRITLTQLFLQGTSGTAALGGPLEVLCALTPVMSVTTLVVSLVWEKLWVVLPESAFFNTPEHLVLSTGLIMVGAVLAFCLVWTEYKLIRETSGITFMIMGTLKELLTVGAAVFFLEDSFVWINALGFVVVIAGVVLFKVYKLEKIRKDIRLLPVEPPGGAAAAGARVDADAEVELEPLIRETGGTSDGGKHRAHAGGASNGHAPHVRK